MTTPDEFERRLAARLEETGGTVAGEGVTLAGVEARHRERMRARRLRQGAGATVAAGVLVVLGVAVAIGSGDGGSTQVVADAGRDQDPDATLGPTTTACVEMMPTTTMVLPPATIPPEPILPERAFPPAPCTTGDTTLPPRPPDPQVPGVGEPTTTSTTEAPTTTEPTPTVPADPEAVVPTHGTTAWAVYLAVADEAAGPEAPVLQQAADVAAAMGYDSTLVKLACDEGGPWPSDPVADPSEPHWARALYFASELDALRFTDLFDPEVVLIDEVTTYCLD